MNTPQPVSLRGWNITLEPLSLSQARAYFRIGQDGGIWQFLACDPFRTQADAERWIKSMLARQENSGAVTFSVYDSISGKLAGSSSFLDVRVEHGGLEIGYTWYGVEFQRTHVNTATKLALLDHAFATLDAVRVQLQTDARNKRSQAAIARIGAVREGVLRKHKIYPDGYVRDSVIFSITRDEWPGIQAKLEAMLENSD